MTIVAADTVPVEPIAASKFNGCIDVNSGQRLAAGPALKSLFCIVGWNCGKRPLHSARLRVLHALVARSRKIAHTAESRTCCCLCEGCPAHAVCCPFPRPACLPSPRRSCRYDVLLKADKAASNYWISAHVQYRPGSPSGAQPLVVLSMPAGWCVAPGRSNTRNSSRRLAQCNPPLPEGETRPNLLWPLEAEPTHRLSAAGYAVLRYKGAPETLPSTPLPQPGSVAAWTLEQDAQIVMSSQLKSFSNKGVAGGVYREAISAVSRKCGLRPCSTPLQAVPLLPWPERPCPPCCLAGLAGRAHGVRTTPLPDSGEIPVHRTTAHHRLLQVPNATVSLQLNITQPLMEQTGQIRWAINNVAGQVSSHLPSQLLPHLPYAPGPAGVLRCAACR